MFPYSERFGPKGRISPTFHDSSYRQLASSLINCTGMGLEIISKDLASIDYPEVRRSLLNARKDGIAVWIYAKEADEGMQEWLRNSDCTLHIHNNGFAFDDYFISDGTIVLSSVVKDGYRIGEWEEDGQLAKNVLGRVDSVYKRDSPTLTSKIKRKDMHKLCRRIDISSTPSEVIREKKEEYNELLQKISSYGKADIDPDEIIRSLRDRDAYDENWP